jgi:Zn-dependent metalloprotease
MPQPQGIIPPIVLEKIEQNARTIEARNAARRTLAITKQLEEKRKQAVEPQQGEDREIYDSKNTSGAGEKVRLEDAPDTDDETVNALYDDTGRWFDVLIRRFARRSYDGVGATMRVIAHFEDKFDNAYWDGTGIWVGDGFYFKPFYLAQTVTLHEWTHALTEKTIALVYSRQPGALNEAISDCWAAAIEQFYRGQTAPQADWLIGRELFGGSVQGRALRDMATLEPAYDDPIIGKDPQTKHMRDYYSGSQDNYGVHINSGIPNRAFALASIHRGGMTVDTLLPVLADVMLRGLVGSNANFQEFATAMRRAAVDRFGVDDPTVAAVEYGWAEVGITIGEAPPVPGPAPLPESPCLPAFLAWIGNPRILAALTTIAAEPESRRLLALGIRAEKEGGTQ